MTGPVRRALRMCLLTETAQRGRELECRSQVIGFRPTDGVTLTGRRFSAWVGLLHSRNHPAAGATGPQARELVPTAETLLLEAVHAALAAGSVSAPQQRSALVSMAATALELAERISLEQPETMPERTRNHVDRARRTEELAAQTGADWIASLGEAVRRGQNGLPLDDSGDGPVNLVWEQDPPDFAVSGPGAGPYATAGPTFAEVMEHMLAGYLSAGAARELVYPADDENGALVVLPPGAIARLLAEQDVREGEQDSDGR